MLSCTNVHSDINSQMPIVSCRGSGAAQSGKLYLTTLQRSVAVKLNSRYEARQGSVVEYPKVNGLKKNQVLQITIFESREKLDKSLVMVSYFYRCIEFEDNLTFLKFWQN